MQRTGLPIGDLRRNYASFAKIVAHQSSFSIQSCLFEEKNLGLGTNRGLWKSKIGLSFASLWLNSKTQIVMKLKNSKDNKTQKLKWWQNSKTQIVKKNSKNQIVKKLKLWEKKTSKLKMWQNSNCDTTWELKLWQKLKLWRKKTRKTYIVIKLKRKRKNSISDKT